MLRPEIRRAVINIVSSVGVGSVSTMSQVTVGIMTVLMLAVLLLLPFGIKFIWKKSAISAE